MAQTKVLRGIVPGKRSVGVAGAGGRDEGWWKMRSGQEGPHRQGRHIICYSNLSVVQTLRIKEDGVL